MIRIATSASDRGLEFNMSFKRTKAVLNTKRCFFTGVELEKDEYNHDNYLTFERLDPTRGYVDDNVVACAKHFNQKKSNLTFEDIKIMYNKLKNKGLI